MLVSLIIFHGKLKSQESKSDASKRLDSDEDTYYLCLGEEIILLTAPGSFFELQDWGMDENEMKAGFVEASKFAKVENKYEVLLSKYEDGWHCAYVSFFDQERQDPRGAHPLVSFSGIEYTSIVYSNCFVKACVPVVSTEIQEARLNIVTATKSLSTNSPPIDFEAHLTALKSRNSNTFYNKN